MGSIHQLTGYIPNLAETACTLKPLLKTSDKYKIFDWKPEHASAFQTTLKFASKITENRRFNQNLETRVLCDASKFRLAPPGLMNKRADYRRYATAQLTCQWHFKHYNHSISVHSTQNKNNHSTEFTLQNQQTSLTL